MPRLDFWFRLFHHAALGLASVCLLYAEAPFLPTPLLLCLYLLAALQVAAFGADGRRWLLPAWTANLLAGAVAGGGAAWIVMELHSDDLAPVLAEVGYAAMLPYIGPVLIGLLVVKMFRPRTPRDFWLLQGVGALQVALACVLASSPQSGLVFGLFLAAYVAFALGCLGLHYFHEEQGDPKAEAGRRPGFPRAAWRHSACGWALGAAAAAVPLFLLTPRLDKATWNASKLSLTGPGGSGLGEVGYSLTMDLDRTGLLQSHGEEVFRVAVAAPDGQTAPDLPADQHWARGRSGYVQRRPLVESVRASAVGVRQRRGDAAGGPGAYRLDITVQPRARRLLPGRPRAPGQFPRTRDASRSAGRVGPADSPGRLAERADPGPALSGLARDPLPPDRLRRRRPRPHARRLFPPGLCGRAYPGGRSRPGPIYGRFAEASGRRPRLRPVPPGRHAGYAAGRLHDGAPHAAVPAAFPGAAEGEPGARRPRPDRLPGALRRIRLHAGHPPPGREPRPGDGFPQERQGRPLRAVRLRPGRS